MKSPFNIGNKLVARKKTGFSFAIIFLIFTIIIPLNYSRVFAVTKPTITISPFLSDVKLSTNDATKNFPLRLTNNGKEAITFSLSVLDFGSLNDTGGIVFAGSQSNNLIKKYGLASWLQLSTNSLTIEPGQTTEITATIINDLSLQPGGHYAAIVASADAPNASRADQISINQKLSSLIFATKRGGEKYDLSLDKIDINNSKFHLPSTVTLHFHNPGNVHVVPRGTVKIVSRLGIVIAQGVINEESGYVLPETSRKIIVDLHGVNSIGFLPSLYHVQVDYRYDGIDQYARKTQILFYLNAPSLLLLGLLFVVLITFTWKYRHFISKKTGLSSTKWWPALLKTNSAIKNKLIKLHLLKKINRRLSAVIKKLQVKKHLKSIRKGMKRLMARLKARRDLKTRRKAIPAAIQWSSMDRAAPRKTGSKPRKAKSYKSQNQATNTKKTKNKKAKTIDTKKHKNSSVKKS